MKELLGQYFSPDSIVKFMVGLMKKRGRTLEPSCGDGAFSEYISKHLDVELFAVELDETVAPAYAIKLDFFAFPDFHKFDTIIGNPPYVKAQDILPDTRELLGDSGFLNNRANLYLHFIGKSLSHLTPGGELIFITPREFLRATSSVKLNKLLFDKGTITHFVELGDRKVFADAAPNCVIWRFEMGDFSRKTKYCDASRLEDIRFLNSKSLPWESRNFVEVDGDIYFTKDPFPFRFKDFFFVKVGAVSGCDYIFAHEKLGNQDFVCSETARSGALRRMIYNKKNKYLERFKSELLDRRVKKFSENNWWMWGRDCYHSDSDRVYVNSKTRNENPFFKNDCKYYDGSVLAIFPRNPDLDMSLACDLLNSVNWSEIGFVCDGRFIFSQRSLENSPLPGFFAQLSDRLLVKQKNKNRKIQRQTA